MPSAVVLADRLPEGLRQTVVGLLCSDGRNLTARQLGVFLVCYLEKGPHTVRGLAVDLNVPKPAITMALDRLGAFGLARRVRDPRDRRSVVVQRTRVGLELLSDLRTVLTAAASAPPAAAREARKVRSPTVRLTPSVSEA